jgi:lipoprotein-anchoring transpeptidase ErfK/SrfK
MPRFSALTKILLLTVIALAARTAVQAGAAIEAITFAVERGEFYLPLDEALTGLQWTAQLNRNRKCIRLNATALRPGQLRSLPDGSELLSTADLESAGALVFPDPSGRRVEIVSGEHALTLTAGRKRAAVSLAHQQLTAWQGERLVMQCRVSSGRNGRTPAGHFQTGPDKDRLHRSKRYNNAPMPWAVQINGHVFIHGFTSVPRYPASHGCIRVPLNEGNPAKFFFEWVDLGVPVEVTKD